MVCSRRVYLSVKKSDLCKSKLGVLESKTKLNRLQSHTIGPTWLKKVGGNAFKSHLVDEKVTF